MVCFKLPVKLCRSINSILARFWWGKGRGKRSVHWISWRKLGAGKFDGGLGFHDLELFNKALVAKQGWKHISDPNSLLSQILKGRYYPKSGFMDAKLGSRPSWIWRSILWARPLLKFGCHWSVGNGRSIRVWKDPWMPKPITFRAYPRSPIGEEDRNMMVADLICPVLHQWNDQVLNIYFKEEDANLIRAIPLSWRDREDKVIWHYDKQGQYVVKSGYKVGAMMVRNGLECCRGDGETSTGTMDVKWKLVWICKVPNKIKMFMWQCFHDILPVGKLLNKRGMMVENVCEACGVEDESVCHILRDCQRAKVVWFGCHHQIDTEGAAGLGFADWWQKVISKWNGRNNKDMLQTEAMYVLWRLWKARNDHKFNDRIWSPVEIIGKAMEDANELSLLLSNGRYMADLGLNALVMHEHAETDVPRQQGGWTLPPSGHLKMNVDGAWIAASHVGGAGCIIRNDEGVFKVGKVCKFPHCGSALQAEALALREGLSLLVQMRCYGAVIEGDAMAIYAGIKDGKGIPQEVEAICHDIKLMMVEAQVLSINFISRNCNRADDALSKFALSVVNTTIWMDGPPSWLVDVLAEDLPDIGL